MSFWKKTMDYLGLGPDDAYDDYDEQGEAEPPARNSRSSGEGASRGGKSSSSGKNWPAESDETVDPRRAGAPELPVARLRVAGPPGRTRQRRRLRRPSSLAAPAGHAARDDHRRPGAEPATVRPRRFDQAQELADKFKDGQAVILNLEAAERDVARRLIDFASGVCYSLDGSMEKVATGVYLLKPAPQRVHRFDDYES